MVDEIFLQKMANFVNIATNEISSLKSQVNEKLQKEASDNSKYLASIKRAAQVLYDTDFITDDTERQKFMKQAAEDPSYVASVLEKVCNAADVSLIGKPARVAARSKKAEFDPVMARAFGYSYNGEVNDILDL